MKYRKYQFVEKTAPSFLSLNLGCNFCQGSIKENETYFKTTEGWGVDIIQICKKCFENETTD